MRRAGVFLLMLLAGLGAAVLARPASADDPVLRAVVGPGFSISLRNADGTGVTQLAPGTYRIIVEDRSEEHNFHLSGPGVNEATGLEFVGTVEWTVRLTDGAYRFVCDPHASAMRGQFSVGAGATTSTTTTTTTTSTPRRVRLTATVGPGPTIAIRDARGRKVTRLKAGLVTIVVRDRSRFHNFRLRGPGLNRATTVRFRGTRTWNLRLRKGVYAFRCDPHRARMRGTLRVF